MLRCVGGVGRDGSHVEFYSGFIPLNETYMNKDRKLRALNSGLFVLPGLRGENSIIYSLLFSSKLGIMTKCDQKTIQQEMTSMIHRLKELSPVGKIAFLSLILGGFIFAKQFAYHLVVIFSPWNSIIGSLFDILLGRYGLWAHIGAILIAGGIAVLYKRQEVITTQKAVVNVLGGVLTLGSLITITYELIFDGVMNEFNFYMIEWKLLGDFGWGYHVAFILFIAGITILLVNNLQNNSSVSQEIYKDQHQEEVQPMQQKQQLSVAQWLGTLILIGIPFVNLILLLVWGFGADNPRKNFSLATLLYALIAFALSLLVVVIVMASSI